MSKDVLRYDLMVQEALKGVVRKILSEAARDGLPGEHHFYVTFRTGAPGVRLSQRLREKHPEEMTIVLQHQFWDLSVSEHAFEVGLSFSGVPERLLVPFDAVTTFFDPSVQFGLKFETQDTPEEAAAAEPETAEAPTPLPAKPVPAGVPAVKSKAAGAEEADGDDKEAPASESEGDGRGSAEVVSLDSFRKKT
ncbi:SspB family protein [Bosea minatitlanensis]|uniref:SspB family protein n=1 Tax=Bosea minatitlanensis TaxID=128782 RepID=A0ABW0EYF8_9HYPH|nr:ClpXP protease specificity-enhancing factor SspB [Bosea minatitlanensis]MCT4492127.1 ClpXP protease specificity-enhancing factor SspB [Bosea minatitlanensis]